MQVPRSIHMQQSPQINLQTQQAPSLYVEQSQYFATIPIQPVVASFVTPMISPLPVQQVSTLKKARLHYSIIMFLFWFPDG